MPKRAKINRGEALRARKIKLAALKNAVNEDVLTLPSPNQLVKTRNSATIYPNSIGRVVSAELKFGLTIVKILFTRGQSRVVASLPMCDVDPLGSAISH